MEKIKGKSLKTIEPNMHYMGCSFYFNDETTTILDNESVIFENCSFRSGNLKLKLSTYSWVETFQSHFWDCNGFEFDYIDEMPKWHMKHAEQIVSLNIASCNLNNLPEEWAMFSKLRELNAQFNNIKYISRSIKDAPRLEKILLCSNNISYIPTNLYEMKLKCLSLDYNPLQVLPAKMLMMESLENLGLGNTNIDQIPDWLLQPRKGKMKSLSFSGPCSGYDIIKLREWAQENVDSHTIESSLWEVVDNDQPISN